MATNCSPTSSNWPTVPARITKLPGPHVLGEELVGVEASHELDPLKVIIEVTELGVSGYQASDWLRAERSINVGLSDHRRIEAQLSLADTDGTAEVLVAALSELSQAATALRSPPDVILPTMADLALETAMLPRDAFFARTGDVPVKQTVGRVCAE